MNWFKTFLAIFFGAFLGRWVGAEHGVHTLLSTIAGGLAGGLLYRPIWTTKEVWRVVGSKSGTKNTLDTTLSVFRHLLIPGIPFLLAICITLAGGVLNAWLVIPVDRHENLFIVASVYATLLFLMTSMILEGGWAGSLELGREHFFGDMNLREKGVMHIKILLIFVFFSFFIFPLILFFIFMSLWEGRSKIAEITLKHDRIVVMGSAASGAFLGSQFETSATFAGLLGCLVGVGFILLSKLILWHKEKGQPAPARV